MGALAGAIESGEFVGLKGELRSKLDSYTAVHGLSPSRNSSSHVRAICKYSTVDGLESPLVSHNPASLFVMKLPSSTLFSAPANSNRWRWNSSEPGTEDGGSSTGKTPEWRGGEICKSPEKFRARAHEASELAHYKKGCYDVEYEFPGDGMS